MADLMRALRFATCIAVLPFAVTARPGVDPTWEEIDFVMAIFEDLQPVSFRKEREYCGYVGRYPDGTLGATEAEAGTQASCLPVWPSDMVVIASYHTHGTFDIGYFNEVPSDVDMAGDRSLGINGWVATPGGRLWFVDSKDNQSRLVCGIGCLPMAPRFYKGINGTIEKAYTYDELVQKLGE